MKTAENKRHMLYLMIPVIVILILLRFGLYFWKSDGFSGLSMLLPALLLCFIFFALCTSAFFAAWVYQDCRKRGDDPVLWVMTVIITTPFIGLIVYFLRRSDIKRVCTACGHRVSLKAKYCEECGTYMEKEGENIVTANQRTHHLKYIAAGVVSMVLMLICLTGFVVSAAGGNGVNTEPASDERVWNTGVITMKYSACLDGVWKLRFGSASDGFVEESEMTIQNAETQMLYADITCGTVPEGATLVLWLVQGEVSRSVDVTSRSETLEYPLDEFENGKIHVRLQINGVKDTSSEIYIQ